MKRIFIKPKEGLTIRDHITKKLIPSEGMWVQENTYWTRRLKDGDVVLAESADEKENADKEPAAKKGKV